jgi:hypothetical protein
MTIIADTLRDGSFPLAGIGGAGTRVGYHLAAHLALHRLLRQRQRPGPAFLLLDHPTGPFYPEDTPEGEEPQLREEGDRAIVATIFELLRSVAVDLNGDLQILVCDHARLDEPWFEPAVVEDWREGRGPSPTVGTSTTQRRPTRRGTTESRDRRGRRIRLRAPPT